MADYKQSTVSGHAWTRANSLTVVNPLNAAATAIFSEETVVALTDGKHIVQPVGSCSDTFSPATATEVLNLVHPTTGEVIGTATYQDVYVMLASLYLHVAAKRDAVEAAEAERVAQLEAERLALLSAPPPPDEPLAPAPTPAPTPEPPAPAPEV